MAAGGGQLRLVSLTPGDFQGYTQPQTIVGVVSGAVQTVTVVGNGAIKCTGTYGTLIGYDAAGLELGRKDLALINSADCSPPDNPDDVTFGAQGTLVVTSGTIARFEITPMSPLEFAVFDQVGHAGATYTISLGAAPPYLKLGCNPANPVRAQTVACTATMSDGSQFTGKHLKSTDSTGRVIFDQDVAAPTGATFGWPGPAVVSSRIEITATVNGKDTVATASFSVQSRIGQLAGWMNEDVWDAGWSVTPPSRTYVTSGVAPLTSNNPLTAYYPGFVTPGNGYSAGHGALGVNVFVYSGSPIADQAPSGPNTGMIYVTSVPWFADTRYNGAAVGIYLMSSIKSNDPFYKRQKGPPPFCTQTDMATIAGILSSHEDRHWTNGGSGIRALNTQRGYERLIAYPNDPDPVTALTQAVTQLQQAYADTITASNNTTHSVSENYPVCDMRS